MLIIDEISMIGGVIFHLILEKINIIDKYRDKPLQRIICGDVLQNFGEKILKESKKRR